MSLAWGAWRQATDLTRASSDRDLRRMAEAGFPALDTEQGLRMFDAALEVASRSWCRPA
jgi:hypothetical protein